MTSLNSIGAAAAGASAATGTGNKEFVSSTQFLELLVAQIQNQNPLEPMDGTAWVSQLAEFANLEQLTQVNQGLDAVNQGQAGLLNQQAVEMLGREVTYPGDEVDLRADATVDLNYRLAGRATDLVVDVKNANGVKVGEIRSAPRSAGFNVFAWDGRVATEGGATQLAPGRYRFEVRAANGAEAVRGETFGSGRVTGITYERGYPELLLGSRRIVPSQVLKVAY